MRQATRTMQTTLNWKRAILFFAFVWMVALMGLQAQGQELAGIKCIMDGTKTSRQDIRVSYGEGQLFFSSQQAATEFKKTIAKPKHPNDLAKALLFDPSKANKLIIRANHQLSLTKQRVQTRCPITGHPINRKHAMRIAGMEVYFGDAAAMKLVKSENKLGKRASLVFSPKSFDKSFTPTKPLPQKMLELNSIAKHRDAKTSKMK